MADHFQGASVRVQPLSTRHPLHIPAGVAKERPSYTPVHTRLGMEVAKALGIDPAKVLKASLEFPEHGTTTMTVQLFVTEEQMRVALAAVAAIEAKAEIAHAMYDSKTGLMRPASAEELATAPAQGAPAPSSAPLAAPDTSEPGCPCRQGVRA